ncbi:hypothetical protein Bpfe_015819, partial [Biomphalaria pfeifferi]
WTLYLLRHPGQQSSTYYPQLDALSVFATLVNSPLPTTLSWTLYLSSPPWSTVLYLLPSVGRFICLRNPGQQSSTYYPQLDALSVFATLVNSPLPTNYSQLDALSVFATLVNSPLPTNYPQLDALSVLVTTRVHHYQLLIYSWLELN